jgi:putative FmdB family regulatory protein
MPTYEYRCANGHDFEEFFLKMSAAKSELPCPTCGSRGERRLSAGGGLLFKGSGFYITDYGKDGKKNAAVPAKKSDAASSPSSADAAKPSAEKAAPASAPTTPAKGDA